MGQKTSASTSPPPPPRMSGREQKKYIQEAFDTNGIAPLGQHVDAFEREVASPGI